MEKHTGLKEMLRLKEDIKKAELNSAFLIDNITFYLMPNFAFTMFETSVPPSE